MTVWQPSPEILRNLNLTQFMREHNVADYVALYQWSITHPQEYWAAVMQCLAVRFVEPYSDVLVSNDNLHSAQWCTRARLNIASSCFQADPETIALVSQSPGTPIERMSYAELDRLSNRIAHSMRTIDMQPGDAVAIAMPMTPLAVAAYLGVIKAGCVVVSIADSFAPQEIATRLQIADTKLVITQDIMPRAGKALPMYQKCLDANAPRCVVIAHGETLTCDLRTEDLAWSDWLVDTADPCMHIGKPGDAINILFSSGTTGTPKAIPWTHLTPIKCAADAHLHHDIHPGDVLCWPTSLGWMMGPWLVFAALLNKATIALYDDAPLSRGFGEFVRDTGVTMLGVVPSIVKHWRAGKYMEDLQWPALKCYSSTGEASAADDYAYLMQLGGSTRPVIEYCGGTEIGGGYITGTMLHQAQPATFTTPALGSGVVLLDDNGNEADEGEVFLTTPSIGYSQRLLNADHHETYFANTPTGPNGEQLRRHGDQLERLPNGYYRALGRADDTMNLGGIKVSSAEIERVVATHDAVNECSAIAVQYPGGGPSQLVLYTVLTTPCDPAELKREAQTLIKTKLNPLFKIHDLVITEALPRTASNKVMRRVLRKEYVTQ